MSLFVRFFVFLLFVYTAFCGNAQNMSRPDSLKELLAVEKSDSTKILLLLEMARNSDGRPLDGLFYARDALRLSEKNQYHHFKARALENISLFQRKLGNYSDAVEASFKALQVYENLDMSNRKADLLLQIGSHFTNDKNFSKATSYITEALKSFRERSDTFKIMLTLINLGETYRLKGDLDSASFCFNECLQLNNFFKNNQVEGYSSGNLGMVYLEQGKPDSAIILLNNSIELLSDLKDAYSVSVYQSELGKAFITKGKEKEGEEIIRSALALAQKEKLKEQIRDISKYLAEFYEKKEQYKLAVDYRKQYEVYNDSLVNIENVRKIQQAESQYFLDLKEADIRFLEEQSRNRRNIVIFLSVGTILLITLLFFLYRLQLSRKKALLKVSEQKSIIEQREKEKALLLRELNHRVKNNLQMVSSMFSLQAGQLRGEPGSEALTAARHRIDALMLIHQKLYREDVDTTIQLEDYIKELTENLVFGVDKKVDLKLDLSQANLYIDSAIPLGIIINELLTNSLKYATGSETLVLGISLKEVNGQLFLTMTDNGPGFPDDFDIKKSRSLGMKLVLSLIRQLHGELKQSNLDGCWWEIILDKEKLKKKSHEQ